MQPSGDRKAESLRAAASDTKLTRVQNLLAEGVDPNAADPWGRTPLQLAVRYAYNEEAEALKIVQALIAADADGDTPLSHAAVYGYADLVKYLIAEGAEINPRNAEGMTPIAMIEATPPIRGRRRRISKMLEQAGGVR